MVRRRSTVRFRKGARSSEALFRTEQGHEFTFRSRPPSFRGPIFPPFDALTSAYARRINWLSRSRTYTESERFSEWNGDTARTVVRPGALDKAWDTVLADFPVQLRPHMRRYTESRRVLFEAKDALGLAKIPHRIDWDRIDTALARL